MSLQDNLTVLFTNRNTLPLLKAAITSFLDHYPNLKSCILVFDDFFEETGNKLARKWLTEQKIQWTSWTKFKRLYPILVKQNQLYYTMRYSYILHDILPRISTPKVLICDSDVLFLRGGFIEAYWQKLKKGIELVCPITWYPTRSDIINSTKYAKNSRVFPEKPFIITDPLSAEDNLSTSYIKRFHSYFSLIDLKKLRNFNLYHDDISNKDYLNLHCKLSTEGNILPNTFFSIRSGTDWLYRIIEKDIPYYDNELTQYNPEFSFLLPNTEISAHTTNPETFVYHLGNGAYRVITARSSIQDTIRLNKPLPGTCSTTDFFTENLHTKLRRDIEKDPVLLDIFKKYYPWMFG